MRQNKQQQVQQPMRGSFAALQDDGEKQGRQRKTSNSNERQATATKDRQQQLKTGKSNE
jgi:hypothetical protein